MKQRNGVSLVVFVCLFLLVFHGISEAFDQDSVRRWMRETGLYSEEELNSADFYGICSEVLDLYNRGQLSPEVKQDLLQRYNDPARQKLLLGTFFVLSQRPDPRDVPVQGGQCNCPCRK